MAKDNTKKQVNKILEQLNNSDNKSVDILEMIRQRQNMTEFDKFMEKLESTDD